MSSKPSDVSVLFAICGTLHMGKTCHVPHGDDDEDDICSDCEEMEGVQYLYNVTTSGIKYSCRAIKKLLPALQERHPKTYVTVAYFGSETIVPISGGLLSEIINADDDSPPLIDSKLDYISSIQSMAPLQRYQTAFSEYLATTKRPIPKTSLKSIGRALDKVEKPAFDQIYLFLTIDDIEAYAPSIATVSSPHLRWFIISKDDNVKLPAVVNKNAKTCDFQVVYGTSYLDDTFIPSMLPTVIDPVLLHFGHLSTKITIDGKSDISAVNIVGFLPAREFNSNLAQFPLDDNYVFQIGPFDQEPENKSSEVTMNIKPSNVPDTALLPLLLQSMVKESKAALCTVTLSHDSEYMVVRRTLRNIHNIKKVDECKNVVKNDEVETTHAILFATDDTLCTILPSDDTKKGSKGAASPTVTLALILVSSSAQWDRPGWPPLDRFKAVYKSDAAKWASSTVTGKRPPYTWTDRDVLTKMSTKLTKIANRKDVDALAKESRLALREMRTRGMDSAHFFVIFDRLIEKIKPNAEHIKAIKDLRETLVKI